MDTAEETVNWTVDMEVTLFHAMRKHKPVGVNRHFQMVLIHNKVNDAVQKRVAPKNIWKHLSTLYDLQALNESQKLPFPNGLSNFELPEPDYKDFKEKTFPRIMKDCPPSLVDQKESAKESPAKESTKEAKESSSKVKTSTMEKVAERLLDTSKSEDSPKRDQRKRTRQAVQSPATDASQTKRARRT